jgi:hypothetical protein
MIANFIQCALGQKKVLDKAEELALITQAIILENEIASPTLREIETYCPIP